jgi:hypothetical protein
VSKGEAKKLEAGFAKVSITPPPGVRMYGFLGRDRERGAEAVHDELYARALYLKRGGQELTIMGFDLLFFSRAEADRYIGAVGRALNLAPAQILLNTSHTHCSPTLAAGTWMYSEAVPGERDYGDDVERAVVRLALEARAAASDASLSAGAGRSRLPMSRRKKDESGNVLFAPDPAGAVCSVLPVCLVRNVQGDPMALLFSVSCHPSTVQKHAFSAEYPGVAMKLIDEHLGKECSLFLQGCGGDAKPSVVAESDKFRYGSWDDVEKAGRLVADEVIGVLDAGLEEIEPELQSCLVNVELPLEPAMTTAEYRAVADDPEAGWRREWAGRQAEFLKQGKTLPSAVPLTVHGVKLGKGLRFVGLEGEAVGELGNFIARYYGDGVTFPLGYTDGCQMYLPTSAMLEEGGYEAASFDEYGYPSNLLPGIEDILQKALEAMRSGGIE